jgi:hypothetical protein
MTMETQMVTVDRAKAQELYQEYKKHQHWSRPIDRECMRAYELIAKGRMVIQALESVKRAGLKSAGVDAGFPILGLCRADAIACTASFSGDGSLKMCADGARHNYRDGNFVTASTCSWEAGSFPRPGQGRWRAKALVPAAPLNLRPKRGLQNYHVLWEAEWTNVPPYDPMLVRRIGKGDLWLVVAHWDLTAVERAALSTRL